MAREPSSPPSPCSPPPNKRSTNYWSFFSQGQTDAFASPPRGSANSTPTRPHWRKNRADDGSSIESNHRDTVNEMTSLLIVPPLRNTREERNGTQRQGNRILSSASGASPNHSFKWSSPHRSLRGRQPGSSSKASKTVQPLLLQSMRHWDTALPPPKKHVVDGELVETFRGSLYGNDQERSLPVAKRKLTIELFGLDHDTKLWGNRRRRNFSDLEKNRGSFHCASGGSSCGGLSCGSGGDDDSSWELFKGFSSDDLSSNKDDWQSDTSSFANDGIVDERSYELAEKDIVVIRVMKARTVTQYDDEFNLGDNSISGALKDRKWESQSMSDRTMSWMVGSESGNRDSDRDDNSSFSSTKSLMRKNVRWTEDSRTRLSQVELVRADFEANEVDLKMGTGARTVVQTFRFDDVSDYGPRNRHEGNSRTFARLFWLLKRLEKERARTLTAVHRVLLSERDSIKQGGEIGDSNSQHKAIGWGSNSTGMYSSIKNDDDGDCDQDEEKGEAEETVSILVEIVSASNLPPSEERITASHDGMKPYYIGVDKGNDLLMQNPEVTPSSDPYVVIRDGKTDVHATSFIPDTVNPIWTLSTGSLWLLQSNLADFFDRSNVLEFTVKNYKAPSTVDHQTIGTVMVHKTELLNGTGERKRFQILQPSKSSRGKTKMQKIEDNSVEAPYLYLRYREASIEDIDFMKAFQEETKRKSDQQLAEGGVYASETFLAPQLHTTPVFQRVTEKKDGEDGQNPQYRVKPKPDPENVPGTEWMTEKQIEEVSKDHSTSWTMAGSGSIGKLYIEILGCDGLANTASAQGDKIDPFVNIIFEDSIVNSDVIHCCLSPRWMPWSQRAFVMNMMHISSQIFIGVFHYNCSKGIDDSTPADANHHPLGRAVINISNLRSRAIHTLTYNLYDSDDVDRKSRGTITIRLRIAIDDEREALLAELNRRDHCNVSTVKGSDFQCASYSLTKRNQHHSLSLPRMKKHADELLGYIELADHITDALAILLLWKSHFPVTIELESVTFCHVLNPTGRRPRIVLNLPLHSMIAFAWATILAWDIGKFFSFFWFAIGWAFLAELENQRRHPSPWRRPRSYTELLRTLLFHKSKFAILGRSTLRRRILPNERLEEIEQFESDKAERAAARQNRLEELRAQQKQNQQQRLEEEKATTWQDIRNYQNHSPERIRTDDKTIARDPDAAVFSNEMLAPFEAILFPIQKTLSEACRLLRVCSSAFLWKDTYLAFWITSLSFSASFVAFWIPWGWLIQWGFRLFVWPFFGPWMKILDIYYFQERKNHSNGEEIIFQSEAEILAELYNQMLGREEWSTIQKENTLKANDMKRYMFGKYSMKVPVFQEELLPCEPDVSSSSVPYNTNPRPVHITKHIQGQWFTADMVPYRNLNSNI